MRFSALFKFVPTITTPALRNAEKGCLFRGLCRVNFVMITLVL